MAAKLQKAEKSFPAIVFPQVMQNQVLALDSAKYTPMFASAMDQGLDMVNPHCVYTKNNFTNNQTTCKTQIPKGHQSQSYLLQENPTSAVSQKAPVVKMKETEV